MGEGRGIYSVAMFQKMATPFGVAIFTGTAGNLIAHAE